MAIDRRAFLMGATAGLLAGSPSIGRAAPSTQLLSAWSDGEASHGLALFDLEQGLVRQAALPARGHAIAVRPLAREAIVFARRPGRFAVVIDLDGRKAPHTFSAEPQRHFFGHGIYADGGRLLFSSENDIEGERGILGIRDATDGYRSIGVFPTAGTGPHDIAQLSDRRTLVVANGGITTDPNGRDVVDLAGMRASIAYVDLKSGDLLDTMVLGDDLRMLSIRHLAIGRGDLVAFGCQWEGERTEHPPLVGLHRRGEPPVLLSAPPQIHRRLRGYIGSVAMDHSGEILAASSPKGGLVVYWDTASERYLGATELAEVCGLAAGRQAGEIMLTSGLGAAGVVRAEPSSIVSSAETRTYDMHWDNHITAVRD